MPQTGAAGFRRSDRALDDAPPPGLSGPRPEPRVAPSPPPVVAFDPDGEIAVSDRRRRAAFDPAGEIVVTDSRAATRAAMADQFAAAFGLDGAGPSADAIADRYDFRYERADGDPALLAGRRTVTITGRGAERAIPPTERALPRGTRSTRGRAATRRTGALEFRGDRAAMWAVALALLLAFVAATSAHAATLHALVSVH